MATTIARPDATEFPAALGAYIAELTHDPDGVSALERQRVEIAALARLTPEQAAFCYAEGKWSVREVVGHMTDTERIFSYRLLRIARGDRTLLAPFDEQHYAASSNAARRDITNLASELSLVREASIALVRSLDERVFDARGLVQAGELTARAQVFLIAGHFAHHATILRERYRLDLDSP